MLAALAATFALSLGPPPADGWQEEPRTAVGAATGVPLQALEVTGRVLHDSRGYFIRGTSPAEIFRITNPNPVSLDKVVAAGQPVKLQVHSVVGDNVAIDSIDGIPYATP